MNTVHQPKPTDRPAPSSQRDMAMIAHDMRSALQGVIGGIALLDGTELAPSARAQIDRVAAAAKNLTGLVGALIGEEPEGERRDGVGRIELARFLRHVAKRWSGEAEERGLRFILDAAPDLPATVQADRALLSRTMGNLIGNATRYAWSGDLRLNVRRTADDGVVFEVIDEGPGMPQAAIDKVLRPGPGPSEASATGHGLGLHIVRSFSVEMGATFSLARRPSGGTEAKVAFPGALCGDAQPVPLAKGGAGAADLTGVRILLAEDNPTNQIVATQMLRALNAEVTLSCDGVEAMERFEEGEFDLIVVDIEMPRMTGLDVIRAIRGRSDGRDAVPIVALTAYAMREHRERIAVAGANGLISKPITSVEALGQALRAHVAPARRAAATPAFAEGGGPRLDEPVADLEIFDALCAAIGPGMMAELLEKVVADLMQTRRDLVNALAPLERKTIRSASHILISVAGAIGATRLQACARTLNTTAHGDEARGLPDDVRRCIDEIDAAVAFASSRRASE